MNKHLLIPILSLCTIACADAVDLEAPPYEKDAAVLYYDHTGQEHAVLLVKELEKQLLAAWEAEKAAQAKRKSLGIAEGAAPPRPLILVLDTGSFDKDTEEKLAKEVKKGKRKHDDLIEAHQAAAKATLDASGYKKDTAGAATKPGSNLLSNGSFENLLMDWTSMFGDKPKVSIIDDGSDGDKCLHLNAVESVYTRLHSKAVNIDPAAHSCTVNYDIKTENVETGGKSWETLAIKVRQYDDKGNIILEKELGRHTGTEDWKTVSTTVHLLRACHSLDLMLEFHKPKGKMWLDKFEVIPQLP